MNLLIKYSPNKEKHILTTHANITPLKTNKVKQSCCNLFKLLYQLSRISLIISI